MRAVIINEYGGSPVVADVPTPHPGPHQMLIKLQAAGMNPMDRNLASGAQPSAAARFPLVLGADGAGTVEQLGAGTTLVAPGDEVFGQWWATPFVEAGTFAEYVVASEDGPLARAPDGLVPVVAAALPTAGMTGLALVEPLAPLDGKTVLIVGAGGGVGSFATQFAANAGAHVIATVRAAESARLRSYGARETVDRTAGRVVDQILAVHPAGVDVLLDLASDAENFAMVAACVRPGGMAVTTRYVADVEALQRIGVTAINFALPPSRELLTRVVDAVTAGKIVPPPITRITLDEAPALLSGATSAPVGGKTVITL